MPITLSKPFARNSNIEPHDVQQIKKALNRLGYYQPNEKIGIIDIADEAVFDALKAFQQDHALPVTGSAKPDDDTITALNREAEKTPDGVYIWRTVEDSKVRKDHAALNRTIRRWDDAPDPGEDYNCRCWAEPVNRANGLHQDLTTEIKNSKKWETREFLKHFFLGKGREVTLAETGYLSDIINKAEEIMYHRLENQISDQMRSIKNGTLIYWTEKSYPEFGDAKWIFGGGTIKTVTSGQVIQSGDTISINAEVQYAYYDEFTDIVNMRQFFIGPHKLSDLPSNWRTSLGVAMSELAQGEMYSITGNWKTKLTGTINLQKK
jgi:peptidoglycan hydrolase-like protein with peptidoglycan-binding domain